MQSAAGHLLIVCAVVFAINLLPAFGPPTWAALVFFRLRYGDVPAAALIVGGACAAAGGRVLLALAFRRLSSRLSAERVESLEVLGEALVETKGGLLASVAVFAVSPIPSAQMFEAVGLTRARLKPFVTAFLAGRVVSYAIYVAAAAAAEKSLTRLFKEGIRSPTAIGVQVLALLMLIAIVRIDWIGVVDWTRARWARARGHPPPASVRPARAARASRYAS